MKHLAVLLAITLLAGCANKGPLLGCVRPEPRAVIQTTATKISTYGLNGQEKKLFEYAISKLEPNVQKSVRAAVLLSQKEYEEHGGGESGAHSHPRSGDICMLRDTDDRWMIMGWWHEAGHAWRWRLPTSADDEWKKIAGKVYANTYDYDLGTMFEYPKDGLLRLHASADHDEDMVIYIESIYAYIYLDINRFCRVGWNDPRYLQKIKFLRKWGGISQGAYEAALTLPIRAGHNIKDRGF